MGFLGHPATPILSLLQNSAMVTPRLHAMHEAILALQHIGIGGFGAIVVSTTTGASVVTTVGGFGGPLHVASVRDERRLPDRLSWLFAYVQISTAMVDTCRS